MIRVGFFADAHYAQGITVLGTRTCSLSLEKTRRILNALNDVDVLVELGDLINVCGDHEKDMENVREMQALLSACPKPVHVVLGNHDVETARKSVFLPGMEHGYYSFDLEGIRFIVLDGNFNSDGQSYEDIELDWTDSCIPGHQLKWLGEQLDGAQGGVVVLCHQNLDDRPGDPHVIRNAAQVRGVMEASGKVMAVVQGHCHAGCRNVQGGISYYTLRALCERENVPCAVARIENGRFTIEERELTKE